MNRYLTDDEKQAEVARWLADRSGPENQAPPGQGGGCGYPDPDIFPLTDALNALPGVLTDQSCAGHLHPGEEPGEDALWSGQLWLRLSEPMMARFTEHAYQLLESPTVERCTRIFHQDIGDVADIVFLGNERGKLAESAAAILAFFTELSECR
jgi:hypothetical protein